MSQRIPRVRDGFYMQDYEQKTILTIDADELTQQGVQTALPDRPVDFKFVESSADAVVSLMVEAPHLVIACTEMPDGDGVAMIKNLRAMSPDLPFIILIGEPTKEKVIAAKAARPIDILLKPPDWERLAMKIKARLWIDRELLRQKQEEESKEVKKADPKANGKGGKDQDPAPPPEEEEEEKPAFVEAVPKGAEVANVNDIVAGMKIARTLVFNDVVYGDKGQVLTEQTIKQLNRMGVPEICVYTDPALKRKAEERKKAQLRQASAVANQQADSGGGKVFAKVKRQAIRVDTDIIGTYESDDENGQKYEADCNIVDISAGGCALLTKDKLRKDQVVFLNFILKDMKMKNLRGVVRHSMARGAKPPEFPFNSGIYFDGITERDKERLFNKVFQIERDNKQAEDKLRARFGYGPKRKRSTQ